jgi:DNA polymerase elongation subunit (family B)
MATESLTLHAYDWKTRDEYDDSGHVVIHCWALDRDSKPYLLRFHDFPSYCHIELPLFIGHRRVNWTDYKARQVFESICWRMGDRKPFKYFFSQKEKLYYYRGGRRYPMITVLFSSLRAMYDCKNKLSKPIKVPNLGIVACNVWETNIPLVRKLLTLRNMNYCQWFNIEGVKVTGEDKVSKLEREYVVDRFTMNPIPPEQTSSWVTQPTIFSFDIETYSDRHKALPDPYSSKHVAYMISCIYQRIGDPSTRKEYIILYGDCNPTSLAEVIRVNSEIEMIDTMTELVNKHDPEILTGYNILGYDNPYLDTRLKRRLREWKPMGRLINEPTKMTSFSWGSSGYGHNEINLLDMDGRVMIDLLPIIRRDYKLPLYNLGFVSNYFLGRTKHDVSAKYMFECYELGLDSKEKPNQPLKEYVAERLGWIKSNQDINNLTELFDWLHVSEYMQKNDQGNPIANMSDIPDITLKEHAMRDMKKVVDYCIVDSVLVLDIFEKVHCWIALIEMSNVVGVTPVELFTRGQQLRVLSQVYDEASKDHIVIDSRNVPKMDYSGGFVYEPIPGIYHYIPCLDFKSLYPTVMISHNIDYRTFVPPEMMDKIPDDMCHVIEWDEDVEKKVETDDLDEKETVTETVHYRFKFIKQEHLLGILPRLLVKLISERDAVRKVQKGYEKGTVEWIVLERRQLALKVSANSMYGALGAQKGGKLPLPEAAACVTAKSRESIKLVNKHLLSKGHKIVYGDSVTGDTPVLIGNYNRKRIREKYIEIQNLWDGPWISENGKEYAEPKDIKVWSDYGFTDIKYIMRHKTNKRLYRITTDTGVVTVTEDHSLLDSNGKRLKPKNVKVGDKLMTKTFDNKCRSKQKIDNHWSVEHKNQLNAAKHYHFLVSKMNFDIKIDTEVDENNNPIYILKEEITNNRGVIKKIEDLGYIDDYVYDLETENHHFAAGVGELVVHNTDSSMPDIGITDPSKAYPMAKVVAEELSKLFPPPMLVEDEEVYHTMLCIKKKMYLCIKMTKDGKPVLDRDKLKVKGVVPARRDNCKYQRDSYIDTAWKVLLREPLEKTYDYLIEMCLKLMRRQVHWKDLIVIKGLGAHYKNKSYCMKVFSDELCKIGKPATPGDRLEYLIVKSYGVKDKQLLGYKMRLPSTYLERLESDTPEPIDYVYYMEKALMNCIQKQLFQVGYNKELAELEEKYSHMDQNKVLNTLRKRGYNVVVDQLMSKFDSNKQKVIDYLLNTDLKKIVSPLVSYHIKKRGRIVTRICGEPIKMMVKLIQQKQKCLDVIKSLVPLSEVPKLRPVKLNIITPNLGMSKQQVADQWIKNKTITMKIKTRD